MFKNCLKSTVHIQQPQNNEMSSFSTSHIFSLSQPNPSPELKEIVKNPQLSKLLYKLYLNFMHAKSKINYFCLAKYN